jgi:3-hydroxybutyryl-CoA dehydrogenase
MISAGKLGFKSGEGFRTWPAEEQAALRQRLVDHLVAARKATAA